MWPSRWPCSAASMYASVWSGSGTEVKRSVQSCPSAAAARSASACAGMSGSRRTDSESRVTGSGFFIVTRGCNRCARERLSIVALHEDELLEQRHVLLVLQQRAHERRH